MLRQHRPSQAPRSCPLLLLDSRAALDHLGSQLADRTPKMPLPLIEVRTLTRGESQQTLFRLGHGHPDGFDNVGTIRSTKHARLAEVCGPPLQPTAKLRHRSCPHGGSGQEVPPR